jgi:hypothetical protein
MKQSDIKVGSEIVSPNDVVWTVIKKYSKTLMLIKNFQTGKVVCLASGQFRMFKCHEKT